MGKSAMSISIVNGYDKLPQGRGQKIRRLAVFRVYVDLPGRVKRILKFSGLVTKYLWGAHPFARDSKATNREETTHLSFLKATET